MICPSCSRTMSRTLDGKGDFVCLPCARVIKKENATPPPGSDFGRVIDDLFGGVRK